MDPRRYPSVEKRIQDFISRRSPSANQILPSLKPGPTRLQRTISAQRHCRQLYDTEAKESQLRLRHTFRTSGCVFGSLRVKMA